MFDNLLGVLILAGGEGKRMNSNIPKVLHKINNKPLIVKVLESADGLKPNGIGVIVGKYKNEIKNCIDKYYSKKIDYILQESPLGTGHAVQCAESFISKYKKILILSGDVPLISTDTLLNLSDLKTYECNLLTANLDNPYGYGRIKYLNSLVNIIEEKDADENDKKINEVNAGIYCFDSIKLNTFIKYLNSNNNQNEYYLTDVIKYFKKINLVNIKNTMEIQGINTKEQLLELENRSLKIGVIGLGFVGSAIYNTFKSKNINVTGYDIDISKTINTIQEVITSDILFLCLPTQYIDNLKEYNKKPLLECCKLLESHNYEGIIVIKSTLEPTTTNSLCDTFKYLKFIHNPEFLTAATAYEDFKNQAHIVLGKSKNCTDEDVNKLKKFYESHFVSEISLCTSDESESMKIFVNNFYSVKIQFFNELYLLCQKLNINYDKVKDLMLKNNWINPMHTQVPGTDGNLSYGGYCFPKDTNALLQFMKRTESECEVLEATINERNKFRKDNININ